MTISLTPPLTFPRRHPTAARVRARRPAGVPSTARQRALLRNGAPEVAVVVTVPVRVTTAVVPAAGSITALPRPGWSTAS